MGKPRPLITLYHCHDARSFRPLWTLEELGVDYELKMLPFPPRFQAREYLALNPLGTIPLLLEGAVRMTESAAICQYLVDRHGGGRLAVEVRDAAYGAFLNGLHFGEATLTFPLTLVLRYGRLEAAEKRLPQVVTDYGRWFLARLRVFSALLGDQAYVCGDRFTVADISVGYALLLAGKVGLDASFTPETAAYWRRLQERDGYLRAQAAQRRAAEAQVVAPTDFDPN